MRAPEIMEIIDHHRLGTVQTMAPVFFRNQPLGCTATIIYQMYQESKVDIEPKDCRAFVQRYCVGYPVVPFPHLHTGG